MPSAPGYADGAAVPVTLADRQTVSADLTLGETTATEGSVTGLVTSSGQPLAGTTIIVTKARRNGRLGRQRLRGRVRHRRGPGRRRIRRHRHQGRIRHGIPRRGRRERRAHGDRRPRAAPRSGADDIRDRRALRRRTNRRLHTERRRIPRRPDGTRRRHRRGAGGRRARRQQVPAHQQIQHEFGDARHAQHDGVESHGSGDGRGAPAAHDDQRNTESTRSVLVHRERVERRKSCGLDQPGGNHRLRRRQDHHPQRDGGEHRSQRGRLHRGSVVHRAKRHRPRCRDVRLLHRRHGDSRPGRSAAAQPGR